MQMINVPLNLLSMSIFLSLAQWLVPGTYLLFMSTREIDVYHKVVITYLTSNKFNVIASDFITAQTKECTNEFLNQSVKRMPTNVRIEIITIDCNFGVSCSSFFSNVRPVFYKEVNDTICYVICSKGITNSFTSSNCYRRFWP